MNKCKVYTKLWFLVLLLVTFVAGCADNGGESSVNTASPVNSTSPANAANAVPIGNKLSITFSEAMDPATINTTTFIVKQGSTPVSGTVTYSGVTAVFTPTNNFAAGTVFTATITTGAKTQGGKALTSDFVWSFTTGTALDTIAPSVGSTVPLDLATGVATNSSVSAKFSEAMDPATITTTTFTLKQGVTNVPGTVTFSGVTAVFTPTSTPLAAGLYTATITTGAKDLAVPGNALTVNKVWSFTIGTATDTIAPTVLSTVPATAATGVATNSTVSATFSEAMAPLTITTTTFTLKQGLTAVPGTVTYSGVIAVFTPASNLAANTTYTATIATGAKDLAGNALAVNKVWSFTTGAAADITAPTVLSTIPANAATGVATNNTVSATFSEAMAPLTITATTFTLMRGATAVPGTVAQSSVTAVFTPTSNLLPSTVYTATITTGAKDLAGNALAVNKVWSFTTGAVAATGPAPVNLGTAGNFVILAKSAISTTVGTSVTGNLGLSPAAASFITGFTLSAPPTTFSTSPLVTGQVFAADYDPPTPTNLTTAVLDMQTAYTDAAGRAPDFTELFAGNIGGQILTPGVYKWGTGVTIPTNVTISGGPNDVWIFQISQDLVMSSATRVNLSGGAQAKNIFWQVFGIVDIGTTAHFEGIALVQTAITLKTGASANGRLLAQTAVNLDQNAVIQPAP